jgi:Sigma-70 region 2
VGTQRLDFAEFYREVKDECLFTVMVSVGDRDAAQDLVAEAFARAWASWRTVSRHPAPAAWVVRTALNAGISRWRRHRREVPVPDLALVADRPAADGGVGGSVDPRIMAALLRLPARQRQVVALRLFLAAWTVARQADGSIKVTIRELRDPAGLQRTLRADGVPASVTFSGQRNPACQGYPGGGSQSQRRQRLGSVVTAPAAGWDVMVIHPAALPSGAGLQINALFPHDPGQHGSLEGFSVGLVQASPQCTGS